MAEVQEPRAMSIKERMAALNLQQVGQGPPTVARPSANGPTTGRPRPPPPPPPQRPALPARPVSSNVPTLQDHGSAVESFVGNQPEMPPPDGRANGMDGISRPALPPRTSTANAQTPPLPSRRPSGQTPSLPPRQSAQTSPAGEWSMMRKASNESLDSVTTARSAVSGISNGTARTSQSGGYAIKAPAYDPSSLPPLPARRTSEQIEADRKKYDRAAPSSSSLSSKLLRTRSTPPQQPRQVGTTPPPAARSGGRQIPSLPTRPEAIQEDDAATARPEAPPRPRVVAPPPKRSALSLGLNPSQPATNAGSAPPPSSNRPPDLGALKLSKPKPSGPKPAILPKGKCLHCRDFSGPDNHAARFPRESLQSQDLGWLAQELTSPFPSHTDKARALFTWLHHNVAYDVEAFFNNNVQPSTPQSTVKTGLAVCEGYAGLFAALAMKAGLEAYVLGGASKGFGHRPYEPGDPIPPYAGDHAWNVVRIDDGRWKLIDCCWGAGTVSGKGQPYNKRFAPERFTQSNEEFGLDHFPGESSQQFREDGQVVSWEDFVVGSKRGCAANFCSGYVNEEGMAPSSFKPAQNPISLANLPGETVAFSFNKCCPHWDPVRNGKGPRFLYLLHCEGMDGQGKKQDIPFETDGTVWWVTVPKKDLGTSGQVVRVYALTEYGGQSARGFTKEQWANRNRGWACAFVCTWTVA